MTRPLVIGIDVGTTRTKICVMNALGEIVAASSCDYTITAAGGGIVTQAPEDWLKALDECFIAAGHQVNLSAATALAISSQGETLICADAQGCALAPAISWMDTRCAEEAEQLRNQPIDWYATTGKPLTGYSTLAKIIWLRRHDPKLADKCARFCQVADFLNYILCGAWVCDINTASFTNLFDIRNRNWDHLLCSKFGLEQQLPAVMEGGSVAGQLKLEWAQRWGLKPGVKVVIGGHDQGCAVLPIGQQMNHDLFLSAGTAWVLYRTLPRPVPDPAGLTILYCHALANRWAHLAAFSGGGVLDAMLRNLYLQGRLDPDELADTYDSAINAELLDEELCVIPHLFGANSPDYNPHARATIFGLGAHHTSLHIVAATALGISFEVRRNLEHLAQSHDSISAIRMAGGACRNQQWPAWVANACNLPVFVYPEADTAPAGAALLAGVGADLWNSSALPTPFTPRRLDPDPSVHQFFARAWDNHQRGLKAAAHFQHRNDPFISKVAM